jgi:hypothetical protein
MEGEELMLYDRLHAHDLISSFLGFFSPSSSICCSLLEEKSLENSFCFVFLRQLRNDIRIDVIERKALLTISSLLSHENQIYFCSSFPSCFNIIGSESFSTRRRL